MRLIFSFGLSLPNPPWSMALSVANLILQLSGTPRNFASLAKFATSCSNQFALYFPCVVSYLHCIINMRQTNKDVGWAVREADVKQTELREREIF